MASENAKRALSTLEGFQEKLDNQKKDGIWRRVKPYVVDVLIAGSVSYGLTYLSATKLMLAPTQASAVMAYMGVMTGLCLTMLIAAFTITLGTTLWRDIQTHTTEIIEIILALLSPVVVGLALTPLTPVLIHSKLPIFWLALGPCLMAVMTIESLINLCGIFLLVYTSKLGHET